MGKIWIGGWESWGGPVHGRVEAGSQVYSRKRANWICPQYRPPTTTAQTLPGDVSFLEGLASLDFPIQTSWGSLPKTGPEIRWKWGNLSKGHLERNYERISWEEVQQWTNRNSKNKEWREQEVSYQRSNRNILKITEISQKRWAWITRFKDSKE